MLLFAFVLKPTFLVRTNIWVKIANFLWLLIIMTKEIFWDRPRDGFIWHWFPTRALNRLRGGNAGIAQPISVVTLFGKVATRCICVALLAVWASCSPAYEPPTSTIDCGRQFIEAVYDGNFKRARQLMMANAANEQMLDEHFVQPYQQLTSAERDKLRNASINIGQISSPGANTTLMRFLNAYNGTPDSILVRQIGPGFMTDLNP
jgi:hypothetical protein